MKKNIAPGGTRLSAASHLHDLSAVQSCAVTTVGIAADLAGGVGLVLTASASLRLGGVGFAVGCGRAIGSVVGGVGVVAGVSRSEVISAAGRDVVSSTGPRQGRAIMRITTSTATPLNPLSTSGRRDRFRGSGAASCCFVDDSGGAAARGAGASSQAATEGGDGGNSAGRPRAAQKS